MSRKAACSSGEFPYVCIQAIALRWAQGGFHTCKEMRLPPQGSPQVWQTSAQAVLTGIAWRENWAWEWPPSSQEHIYVEVQDELLALLK